VGQSIDFLHLHNAPCTFLTILSLTTLSFSFYKTGSTFIGHFVNGHLQGEGRILHNHGAAQIGLFINGKAQGYGKFITPNNTVFEGTYVDGKLQGYGKVTSADGTTRTGPFVDDMQHGLFQIAFKDGTQAECVFENNVCQDAAIQKRLMQSSNVSGQPKPAKIVK